MATTSRADDVADVIDVMTLCRLLEGDGSGGDDIVISPEQQIAAVEAAFKDDETTKELCLEKLSAGTPLRITRGGDASHGPSFSFAVDASSTVTVSCHPIRFAVAFDAEEGITSDGFASKARSAIDSLVNRLVVGCATMPCILQTTLDGLHDHELSTPPPHTHVLQGVRCKTTACPSTRVDANGNSCTTFQTVVTGSLFCYDASLFVLPDHGLSK